MVKHTQTIRRQGLIIIIFEAKDYSLFIPKASSCRRKQSLVQKKKEEQVFLNDISIEIRFFMKIIWIKAKFKV